MATDICNRLEKLIPPPFVTVDTPNFKEVLSHRRKVFRDGNFGKHTELLSYEIDFLTGYIVRKGQQLRLEKALLLTNQVLKVAQRWNGNEFQEHLSKFKSGFPSKRVGDMLRAPSRQWGTWIVYLMLRESALLAKMKLECEKSVPYWLGLIAKAHHWGDSLIITGILSRIWHLCSLLLCEIINNKYPEYLKLCDLLHPTQSLPWPDENFKPPQELYMWIRDTMKLSFEKARLFVNLSYFSRKSSSKQDISSLLSKTYNSRTENKETANGNVQESQPPQQASTNSSADHPSFCLDRERMSMEEFPYDLNGDLIKAEVNDREGVGTLVNEEDFRAVVKDDDEEDLGVVVNAEEVPEEPPRKKRKRSKKKASGNQKIGPEMVVEKDQDDDNHEPEPGPSSGRRQRKRKPNPGALLQNLRRNPQDVEAFKAYWNHFKRICVVDFTPTNDGQQLLRKLRIYRKREVTGYRDKGPILKKLCKLVKKTTDLLKVPNFKKSRTEMEKFINRFNKFIRKKIVEMSAGKKTASSD